MRMHPPLSPPQVRSGQAFHAQSDGIPSVTCATSGGGRAARTLPPPPDGIAAIAAASASPTDLLAACGYATSRGRSPASLCFSPSRDSLRNALAAMRALASLGPTARHCVGGRHEAITTYAGGGGETHAASFCLWTVMRPGSRTGTRLALAIGHFGASTSRATRPAGGNDLAGAYDLLHEAPADPAEVEGSNAITWRGRTQSQWEEAATAAAILDPSVRETLRDGVPLILLARAAGPHADPCDALIGRRSGASAGTEALLRRVLDAADPCGSASAPAFLDGVAVPLTRASSHRMSALTHRIVLRVDSDSASVRAAQAARITSAEAQARAREILAAYLREPAPAAGRPSPEGNP